MARNYGVYSIQLDGRWSLEDLYRFPRTYEQAYFALEALVPSDSDIDYERVERAFSAFPWQGGYSAVNFYNQLKYATPLAGRPSIVAIQYASPGFINLALILEQAQTLAAIVAAVAGSITACNALYNKIINDLQRRKLLRIEVEKAEVALSREQLKLIREYNMELAALLNIGTPDALDERTKRPLVSLKILLSVYRRIRTLAEYHNKHKAILPTHVPPYARLPPPQGDLF
ncbi:hypothetical protein FDV58_17730 [Bradyrhizobium elkanii]|uniref:Uncharacterized protein n=1 Tax=Bradyrhizobium elkanii TaxID=29448 RepID=A0A4U6S277_BRAEL|nr:hypothetical protein [Bradyrhizobium elkanii]TKV80092.1 hypothetical protein FDV58_17730 [Bradyrhizobium elkanii]